MILKGEKPAGEIQPDVYRISGIFAGIAKTYKRAPISEKISPIFKKAIKKITPIFKESSRFVPGLFSHILQAKNILGVCT
jgi:hypothetical protein